MKSISSYLLLVIITASAVVIGQESSNTPWRDGKPITSPTAQAATNSPQSPQTPNEIQNYAPYSIALLPDGPNREVVLPMITTDNKLAFFSVSQVQQASNEKRLLGWPVAYGELAALIGELQIEVDRLKQENNKLWAVVGKSAPPQTVVVQPPPAPAATQPNNDRLLKYLMLRQLFPTPQPYQLQPIPQPVQQPVAPLSTPRNCTTQYIGNTAYTNCQ